jgi:hypothetical protein
MNKLFIFILISTLCELSSSAFAGEKIIQPNNKNIQYIGRWDKSEKGVIRSYWGGAYFNLKFRGNALSLKLDKSVDIYVILDSGKPILFKKANGLIKITPDTLSKNTHLLKVVARFQNDEIVLTGLTLNNGGKLLNPEKRKFWVEYIGDSITSGDRTSKGNISAYPWLCSEVLGVNHTQISYCGIPLVNGFHYNYKGAPEIGMESAYLNLKQPNNNSPEWDFSEASPNLLVINLGTNDNNLKVDTTLFKQTYTQFIRNLRFIHQNAVIMVLIPFNQVYKNQIEELVTKETERDKNLNFISTEGWLTASDFVDGTHPTDLGHQKISDKLTPIIKSYCK